MLRRMLVPLDGSHFAEHAIPHAVSMARRAGATVQLVSVTTPPFSSTHVRGVRIYDDEVVRESARVHHQYLLDCANRIKERYGFDCEEIVLAGSVFERLVEHVAASAADLVVMTTHGGGSPSASWLGSVSDRMIREASVPVLLVRPDASTDTLGADVAYRRVLVPSDGSRVSERVLDVAVKVAGLYGGEVVLFGAVTVGSTGGSPTLIPSPLGDDRLADSEVSARQEQLEELAARVRSEQLQVRVIVERHQYAATAIPDVAARERVDLVAMATHGRGGVRRLLLGSVADKVLRTCTLPMLVSGPGA